MLLIKYECGIAVNKKHYYTTGYVENNKRELLCLHMSKLGRVACVAE